jgi:hypothetical protein
MELKNLSQNWRKLQETLKTSHTISSTKRKSREEDSNPSPRHTKRRAIAPPLQEKFIKPTFRDRRRPKMSENELHLPTSFAFETDNDEISLEEVGSAVKDVGNLTNGAGPKTKTLPKETGDAGRVNEGLSPTYEYVVRSSTPP